jgi:hypothetical protein
MSRMPAGSGWFGSAAGEASDARSVEIGFEGLMAPASLAVRAMRASYRALRVREARKEADRDRYF